MAIAFITFNPDGTSVFTGLSSDTPTAADTPITADVLRPGSIIWDSDTPGIRQYNGSTWNPISTDGADHVTDPAYDYAPTYNDGTYKYYPKTHVLGSAVSAAVWQITRMRISDGQTSYAGSAGSFGKFDQVATEAGLAALTYSQT